MNSNVNSLMISSMMLLTKFENVLSHDLEDWETQEAQMWVHPSVHSSQKIIRFKSMNSSVSSFLEWQKLLDIHESDLDFKNFIKSLAKWLKSKKLRLRFKVNEFICEFIDDFHKKSK